MNLKNEKEKENISNEIALLGKEQEKEENISNEIALIGKKEYIQIFHANHHGETTIYFIPFSLWTIEFQIKLHLNTDSEEICEGDKECPFNLKQDLHTCKGVDTILKEFDHYWLSTSDNLKKFKCIYKIVGFFEIIETL